MSEEQKPQQPTEAQKKEAAARLRSFEVGIGHACNEMGINYEDLAKAAGVDTDTLGPALVEQLVEAATQAEKAAEQQQK
jgi:hypothetical protein